MARRRQTQLTEVEGDALGAVIAATGGLVTISDDVPDLGSSSRELIRRCADLARAVDGAGDSGRAWTHDLLATDEPALLVSRAGLYTKLCALNRSDAPRSLPVDLAALRVGKEAQRLDVELDAHESALHHFDGARQLAVFCDFDGTFSIQDVGSTVAKLYIPDRRAGLWQRYESGELTAWDYTYELLDGLEVSEEQLDAFLRTVDLDPGSVPLLSWCRKLGVPFQILSDGFDRNLEVLQDLHGVEFEYRANHLTFSGGVWRIEPGQPNPSCGCETGTCKGTIISAWRDAHPDAFWRQEKIGWIMDCKYGNHRIISGQRA